jgi:hypothetical protein
MPPKASRLPPRHLAAGDFVASQRLRSQLRNEIMQFHDRKLVFLSGPEGVTVELAQWLTS